MRTQSNLTNEIDFSLVSLHNEMKQLEFPLLGRDLIIWNLIVVPGFVLAIELTNIHPHFSPYSVLFAVAVEICLKFADSILHKSLQAYHHKSVVCKSLDL